MTAESNTEEEFPLRLAKLGGYLGRGPGALLGMMIFWRDMSKLTDFHLAFCLAQDVGY